MGLKIHIVFLLIAVAMAASAPAAEQGNLADSIRSSNEDIGILLSPLVTIRKAAESFAEQRKITFGEADGQGMVYEFGSKTVPATPTSPEFMDARQRTYEEICKELVEKSKHPAEWFRTAWTMEYLDVESGNYEIGVILKADPYLPRALSEQERSAANQTKGLPIYAVLSGTVCLYLNHLGCRFGLVATISLDNCLFWLVGMITHLRSLYHRLIEPVVNNIGSDDPLDGTRCFACFNFTTQYKPSVVVVHASVVQLQITRQ